MVFLAAALATLAPAGAAGEKANARQLQGGSNGKHVQLDAERSLDLSPDAELVRERGLRLDLDGNGSTVLVDVYRLVKGQVDVRFAGKSNTAVMIRAPRRVTAVAKDGHYRMLAVPGSASVAALDKDTLAAVGNDWKPLHAGWARSVSPASAGTPRAILAAPNARAESALIIAADGTANGAVRWQKLSGAAKYFVEVERDGERIRSRETKDARAVLPDLTPGRYAVRVSAVDAFGLAGASSADARIQVVGLGLPEGARAEGDHIWLGPSQRAALVGAEGLEMTYGKSSFFVPAARSVGLSRGRATLLRLRVAPTKEEARVHLNPIELAAKVELSPKLARWPRDEVRVSVHVTAKGTDVPKVTPSVTINGAPTKVSWSRSGSSLSAVVPPESSGGPWVVRVEVRGPRGRELGRGFLEIAPSAPERTASN